MSYAGECPNCLRKITTAAKFCKYCGSPLKICPKCRKINKSDDSFCAECGNDISTVMVVEPTPRRTTETDITTESQRPNIEMVSETIDGERQQKLILWPPEPKPAYSPARFPKMQAFPQTQRSVPLEHTVYMYSKVKAMGFLSGPLPTSNVFSATMEAFGIALALIAAGIVIIGIGLAFYQYLIFPIIAGIIGGALLLSAPFFGIYLVSSNWLYRTFGIRRPVRLMTVIWNYVLSSLLFSLIGLMIAPLFLIQDVSYGIMITFSVIGGVVYIMGLIIIPLKAYWADLIYIKAANNMEKDDMYIDFVKRLILSIRKKGRKLSQLKEAEKIAAKDRIKIKEILSKDEIDIDELFKLIEEEK